MVLLEKMFFKYDKQKVRREKVKRLVVLLSSFLFLCTFASASPLLNFTSPTPADNATVNTSITINVSSDETLDSCILVWDFPQWCYQETANESTACGGLASGLYKCEGIWDPVKGCSETYDGVWGDGGSANKSCTATLYVNYTIPNYNYNSIWKLKYSNLTSNNTLPSGCLNDNVLQFKVHSSVQDTYSNSRSTWLCWNYDLRAWWPIIGWTGWEDGKGIIFEEAVWWYIGTSATQNYTMNVSGNTSDYTFIPTAGDHHYYVWCNNSGGDSNTTETRTLTYETPIIPRLWIYPFTIKVPYLTILYDLSIINIPYVKLNESNRFK